jgi:hypothetical protein
VRSPLSKCPRRRRASKTPIVGVTAFEHSNPFHPKARRRRTI